MMRPKGLLVRTCPGLGHDGQVERILADWREAIEELARSRITDRGGKGERAHAGTPCMPSHLDDRPE